jgi:ribosomal-protein-alanine N-acetyltransferase
MDLIIEPLTPKFVDQVAEIEKECFSVPFTREDILSYLEKDYWHFLIARDKDTVLGYISLTLIIDECNICNVATRGQHRGLGVGSHLVDSAISLVRKNGGNKLFLEVRESNRVAIALYEKFGFLVAGVSKNHYTKPLENALLMSLDI